MRKVEGSNPEASRPPPAFETGRRPLRQHLPFGLAGPIRTDDPCLRRAALCSAELRRGGTRGQIQTDDWGFAGPCVVRYTTRVSDDCKATRTGLEPVTPDRQSDAHSSRAHAPGGIIPKSGWPESNRRPRRPERRALPACATARCHARKGGDDPPPPGSEPGVLPVTPLPNGASPEGRTPICGVRARPVTSYRRDARVGGSPARS